MGKYLRRPIQDTDNIEQVVGKINEMMPHVEEVGDLEQLKTKNKNDLVSAINEIQTTREDYSEQIGDLRGLETVNKTSLVDAINEVTNYTRDVQQKADQAELNAKNYVEGLIGKPNGIASLDENGKIPSSQLGDIGNIGKVSSTADAISVADAGNYYTSTNVEGALQEIGQVLNSIRGSLIDSVNTILDM